MKMTNMQGLLEEVTNFPKIEKELEVLNSMQCKNLLVNVRKGVETIQRMINGCYGGDGFHQVQQEMLGIMKKTKYMVEECCKDDDWCRVVVMQLNNKESFRELFLDFEYCFHTMCDILCQSFPNRDVEIREMEKCTTFYPTSIDEVEQDQNAIFERLSKEVDLCRIDNCRDHCMLLRYLIERIMGLQEAAGGELNSIIFPYIYVPPEYGRLPKRLGEGANGSVYATQWLGFETATKIIEVCDPDYDGVVWKEASILGGLNHPNIINFFYCGLSTECDTHAKKIREFEIVMERGKMSLSSFMERGTLTEAMGVDIMIQIACGMCYLHDMKVAHRDLKPANVILTSMGGSATECVHVKILDFGISKIEVKNLPQVPTNEVSFGTRGYMAPEAHTNRTSEVDAFKMDVFSFGMMCCEILSNKRAYTGERLRDYVKFLENGRPELPETCSKDLKSLINECWSSEPSVRPTFLHIYEKLRKIKSDAMLKVANDVRVANIFHESTTPSNSIEYSKRWWTMVKDKLHGLNIWPIILLWQMFITFAQWLPCYLPISEKTNSIPSANNEEISKLIGLEEKILELEKQLDHLGSLGIVGMGGLGKSTLANALSSHISKKFDAICFVADITCETCTIHVKYQVQDVKEPSHTKTLEEGHKFLKQLQETKKVLIVLDNVGNASQLEVLLGDDAFLHVDSSKVIASSRSWESLKRHVPIVGKVEMETLDNEQSKELFSIHAFATNQPCLPYLEHVVEKIVKACGGLPLSLEVMGSYLYGERRLRIWERTIQRLLRARHDGSIDGKIWEILRISFDELEEKGKNMFLDITCFFSKDSWTSGWVYKNTTLFQTFHDDVKSTRQTLESLQDKSLVKFDKEGILYIHDQLRDMGRMIVEKEFPQTRVCNLSLTKFLNLWNNKSIELVEGLSFTTLERNNFAFGTNASVNTMKSLRFLSVRNCEDIDMLLAMINKTITLKWLRIHFSTPRDNNLEQHTYFINELMKVGKDHLQELRMLELFEFILWTPAIFQNFKPKFLKELILRECTFPQGEFPIGLGNLELEVLNLSHSKSLRRIPEGLGGLTCLKKLNMGDCEALEDFPSGICTLKALEELYFHGCKSLRTIPEGLGGLSCLKKLSMFNCEALEEFPSGICTLRALEQLYFNGCKSLKTMPEGLGGLTCLKNLYMEKCEALKDFPSGICTLKALEALNFHGCKSLRRITKGLAGLNCLKKLCMADCEALEEFHAGICTLRALEELYFHGCKSLRRMHDGLGGLSCLKKLGMWDCEALEEFPSGMCTLKALEELYFHGCKLLKTIPDGLEGLSCLKILNMGNCDALEEFPSGIYTLKALEELYFHGCKSLRRIPDGLGGLSCLKKLGMWDCEALEEFPSEICTLKALKELYFHGCKSLRKIPDGLGGLSCLKILNMGNCDALEEFPSGLCTLKALEELYFHGCKLVRRIPDGFGELSCLKKLGLWDCEALDEFPSGICTLKALEELYFHACKSLRRILDGFEGLNCLRIFNMGNCDALEEFPSGICALKALEELYFHGWKLLRRIPDGFGELSCLKKLGLWDCEALEEFPSGMCTLKALEELYFHGCKSLKTIPDGLGGLSCLKILNMGNCDALEEFPSGICTLKALEELYFHGCKLVKRIPDGFGGLSCLKKLGLWDCEALEEFPSGMCTLKSSEELYFHGCKSLRKIPDGLGGLSCLKILNMGDYDALEEFPSGICTLKALEELYFHGCKLVRRIPDGFGGLSCLKKLGLWDCEALEEFPSGICTLKALEELYFHGCKSLRRIPNGFGGLSCLKKLCMWDCEALEEFPSGICALKGLEELNIYGCRSSRRIPDGLGGLSCLKILNMVYCEALEDFPPGICTLKALEELSFKGCKSLRRIPEGLAGLSCLKILRMGNCDNMEEFPSGICTLKVLEELSFKGCKFLTRIPEGFGGLNCLKKLYMYNCEALEECPSGICTLKALEELFFYGCKLLRRIPEGLAGLNCLKILNMGNCDALEEFPSGICTLKALEELYFHGCKSFTGIPEGLGGLSCLKKLSMENCEALEEFPSGICTLKALEELSFDGCKSLRRLPEGLGGLNCLKNLSMEDCEALEEFPSGICTLKALDELSFKGCKSLRKVPEELGIASFEKIIHVELGGS